MPADVKAQAIHDASVEVMKVVRQMHALSLGVLQPVVGSVEPHADTIAAIKVKMIALYGEWDLLKVALDDAKNA